MARMKRSLSRRAREAPAPSTDVHARVAQEGRRMTPQRAAVHEYLCSVRHHPTAEDVYVAVKRRIPRVSLATVYNALEVLVGAGLAARLTYGDAAARYDCRTDVHSHVRCLSCGRVRDLDVTPDARWLRGLDTGDFRTTGFHFELVGLCAGCHR